MATIKMTKQELADLDKRIADRIARKGIASRPISEAERRRFDELLREREASERTK
jgi:hypothetical protein